MKKGFTLVELVIVIVIVGILSIVAVPIYRGYIEKARITEGKALLSAVRTAQDIYYAEHGTYYPAYTNYDPVLQIDARGNKWFKVFQTRASDTAGAWISSTIGENGTAAEGDRINLFWSVGNSLLAIDGHKLPFFTVSVDGVVHYQD